MYEGSIQKIRKDSGPIFQSEIGANKNKVVGLILIVSRIEFYMICSYFFDKN